MQMSDAIAAVVALLFLAELFALATGKLQAETAKRPAICLSVAVLSLFVLAAIADKAINGPVTRYGFYALTLLFNTALFGSQSLQVLRQSRAGTVE